jgi:hypothetical protein
MFAWKVEPCALNVPVAQPGPAPPPDADDAPALAVETAAGVLEPDADEDVGDELFLLVPHAAAAKSPPTVSSVAAMREVLTG